MSCKLFYRLVALVVFLAASSAAAQTVKTGGLSGTLVSAFAVGVTSSTGIVSIYTTPSTGHFALTQSGGCNLYIQGFTDPIATMPVTFSPGLLLPANTVISIGATEGATCFIIGVLEK